MPVSLLSQRFFIFILASPVGLLLNNRIGMCIVYALAGVGATLVAILIAPSKKVMAGFISAAVSLLFVLPLVIYTFTTYGIDQLLDAGAQHFSASVQMLGLVAASNITALAYWIISSRKRTKNDQPSSSPEQDPSVSSEQESSISPAQESE